MTPPLQANPIQLVSNAASGGTWASGNGMSDASGLVEKEWSEFRQWLTIEYTRNPEVTNSRDQNTMRNLSMVSAVEVKDVTWTALHYRITAHTSCSILSGTYSSSGFHQLQKFAVIPNKYDKMDSSLTYGDVSGAGLVFGPQGKVITSQPFIRRREKGVGDYAYSHTYQGTNHALSVSGYPNYRWDDGDNIDQPYKQYLRGYQDILEPGDVDGNYPHSMRHMWGGDPFSMNGAYAVSAEPGYGNLTAGMQIFEGIIENCAAALNNSSFEYRFVNPSVVNSDNYSRPVEADRVPLMPTYNSSRHDFT